MSKKVLVADDSVVIQKSVGITFAQEDFDVSFVGNGEEALTRAKEFKPDLILADTSMPKLSGADLCRKLRQDPATRNVPIILLSGSQENFSPEQLKAMGANDFIQKPFESSLLLQKIRPLIALPPAMPEMAPEMPAPSFGRLEDSASGLSESFLEDQTSGFSQHQNAIPLEPPTNELDPSVLADSSSSLDPNPQFADKMDVLNVDDDEDEPQDFALESNEPQEPAPAISFSPAPAQKPVAAPIQPAVSVSGEPRLNLSEQQIEQIVSKVFQNVIERIAWEVVPELAERLIREEIQKITDDQ